ncbi:MAG: ATP-binding protein [Mycoplasma sp.]|nr:ATP-binding protein [Mycoplasma sp.]
MNKKNILNNELIKQIIKELKLNDNQIESGYDIFIKIIDENKNINEYEYITKPIIYDDKTITSIYVKNPDANQLIKFNNYHWLNSISNPNNDVIFSSPREKNLKNKIDKNKFYWNYPGLHENDRTELAQWFKNAYESFQNDQYIKGIYIWGSFGLGKTFFLNALSNYFVNKNKSIIFVSTFDLFEAMIRNLDKNNDLNYEIINKMKNVDILIIDDIGSEKPNSWFLFSNLLPILEYRLKWKKTVCFSSNYSIEELKKIWIKSRDLENMKVEKLIDKIKSLTKIVNLKGKNIREIE